MDKLSKENQEWLIDNIDHMKQMDESNVCCGNALKVILAEDVETKLLEMESKLKQANEWISVEDRLPSDSGDYLVFCGWTQISLYSKYRQSWNYDIVNANITHWKEIPKDPTGE